MMKITGLSHLFKWENLHNWWLTKYFFAPLYLNARTGQSKARAGSASSGSACRLTTWSLKGVVGTLGT